METASYKEAEGICIAFTSDNLMIVQGLKVCYTFVMKLIAQVKLNPTRQQAKLLKQTIEQANKTCDAISELAFHSQTFGQYAIHQAFYAQIRQSSALSAQVVVRCIAKVADAYKLDKLRLRTFKPLGAIAYDDRILTWKTNKQTVNIWTVEGRQLIPYLCGERQKQLLEHRQGESDLVYRKGNFFLLAVCDIQEPTAKEIDDAIGVDFGIIKIATDSDGQSFTGERVENKRQAYAKQRSIVQKVGTRAAHRKLKKMSGKQRRYQTNENHRISKEIVLQAKRTKRAIGIEELTHIRSRTRGRHRQRARQSNWAFSQLRSFIEYKAQREGIAVIVVPAAYTSQTCSVCGHCEKANRKSQCEFVCKVCGHSENADYNSAKNIRLRALSMMPKISETQAARGA
jgi:putative transposase